MTNKMCCILLTFIFSFQIFGKTYEDRSDRINFFVLKGWKIIVSEIGDLNRDNIEDMVLIIENTDSKNYKKNEMLGPNILNLNSRRLIILQKGKDNIYTLISKNEKGFIMSESDEDNLALEDPLTEGSVRIVNNLLKIKFHYFMSAGSWSVSDIEYTFRYQNNRFELIGFDENEFMRNSGMASEYSVNLSTNKMKYTTGKNMFSEEQNNPTITYNKINIKNKYILDNINSEISIEISKFITDALFGF